MLSKFIAKITLVAMFGLSVIGFSQVSPNTQALGSNNCVRNVKAYTTKKGKKVKAHKRTCPNKTKSDNLGCRKYKRAKVFVKKCY